MIIGVGGIMKDEILTDELHAEPGVGGIRERFDRRALAQNEAGVDRCKIHRIKIRPWTSIHSTTMLAPTSGELFSSQVWRVESSFTGSFGTVRQPCELAYFTNPSKVATAEASGQGHAIQIPG